MQLNNEGILLGSVQVSHAGLWIDSATCLDQSEAATIILNKEQWKPDSEEMVNYLQMF